MSLRHNPPQNAPRGHVLETAPASEPITADELRTQLRASSTMLADAEANSLIEEARQFIEDQYDVAMINQSWRVSFDDWPLSHGSWWDGVRDGSITELDGAGSVSFPRWPLSSVTSVTTYNSAGAATAAVIADTFDVDTYQKPGRLRLKSGKTWPAATRETNGVEVVYVAGYGSAASNVPAPMRRAVRLLAAYMYEHRGDGCGMGDALKDSGAAAAMDIYKVRRL